jgi:hypothetical protein
MRRLRETVMRAPPARLLLLALVGLLVACGGKAPRPASIIAVGEGGVRRTVARAIGASRSQVLAHASKQKASVPFATSFEAERAGSFIEHVVPRKPALILGWRTAKVEAQPKVRCDATCPT